MALYVWGKNCALSLTTTEREKTVVYPTLMEHFGSEVVTDYAAGDNHALAVTEFGDVYSWGRGKDGELGHGDPRDDQPIPMKIKGLQEHIVIKVACGNIHSMATTMTGHVYMWGLLHDEVRPTSAADEDESSTSGMLVGMAEVRASTQNDPILARVVRDAEAAYREGTNEVSDFEQGMDKVTEHRHRQSVPRLATSLVGHFITKVSAGAGHNLALSSNGEVFSCGYNEHGQLGLGHANTVSSFQQILALQGLFVHDIVCGHQHNLAQVELDGVSRCYTWGLGALGQLGHGTRRSFATPKYVAGISGAIVSVAAGSHHSVAVDDDGVVYTWGHSEYGQHGVAMAGHDLNDAREYFVPRRQQTLAKTTPIASVCCGSHYTLATGRDGRLYSWGWNTYGVLGVGHFLTTTAPQPLDKLNGYSIARVVAGCNQSGAIVDCMGAPHAMRFRHLVVDVAGDHSDKRYDLALTLAKSSKSYPVHWVFLRARCPYLFGYCRAAVAGVAGVAGATEGDLPIVAMEFADLPMLDGPILRAILVYLYTDRLDIAIHKVAALKAVAEAFSLPFLITQCDMRTGRHGGRMVTSSFADDMATVALTPEFADTWFAWPLEGGEIVKIPAHRVVLCEASYFATMLSGRFREGSENGLLSMAGMAADGMDVDVFRAALLWMYTGSRAELDIMPFDQVVDLLVMANMLDLEGLVSVCTTILSKVVASSKSVDVLTVCNEVAESLNMQRLKTQCEVMLHAVKSA